MFEHLSDRDPPNLDHEFRDRVVTRAHVRQGRARRAVGGVVLTPLLVLGGIAVYVRDQANELERIAVGGLAPAETVPSDQSLPSATTPAADEVPPIASPLNVLVVGVDRRPPGSDVEGSRADTIALVRIDPEQQRVSMLSLPRDLWVTTDDGRSGRINSFTDNGGLVEVASSLLGIDINHYIEIDFDGFESLIDLAGGVAVPFDQAVRDTNVGFTADAGCNTLSGADALAYVRSRRLEQLDPATGEWRPDPRSDLGRIARQQDFTQRLYASVLAQNYSTTDKTRLLTDVVDDITVDTGLDLDGLRAIFNAAALIGTSNFDTYHLSASLSAETIDGNAVLIADPVGIRTQVDNLLRPTTDAPADTQVLDHQDAIDPPATSC
jgi:LCP family protein required for cell wall assembly